jgi:alanine racemase
MSEAGRPTVAYIDVAALRANFASVRGTVAPDVAILAVVKGDGYGHGAEIVARLFAEMGAAFFGVATLGEAVALRRAGIAQPILVLAGIGPADVETAVAHELRVALLDERNLAELAQRLGRSRLRVHLKVDTGMTRLGVCPGDLAAMVDALRRETRIELEGVFSHFANADDVNNPFSDRQLAQFEDSVKTLSAAGLRPRWVHMTNSVGTLTRREAHFSMVRPGAVLYGIVPEAVTTAGWLAAMQLRTRIWQIKTVPAGRHVGYNQTFETKRPSRLAVLPIGYADGYPRSLGNRGEVLVRGRRAAIAGRVCMDLTVVDVTDIPDAVEGGEVVLMGRQGVGEISVSEMAGWQETIPYEVLTRVGIRVPRRLLPEEDEE